MDSLLEPFLVCFSIFFSKNQYEQIISKLSHSLFAWTESLSIIERSLNLSIKTLKLACTYTLLFISYETFTFSLFVMSQKGICIELPWQHPPPGVVGGVIRLYNTILILEYYTDKWHCKYFNNVE